MHSSANSNIFETLLKNVMSPWDDKCEQTVATLVVYLTIYQNILRNCVNMNGSPFRETSKYLIRVLMN